MNVQDAENMPLAHESDAQPKCPFISRMGQLQKYKGDRRLVEA